MKKKSKLWLQYIYFVKFLTIYSVPIYVGEKSFNKTHFDLFNTVWQVFPRFYVVLFIWGATVLRLLCFGK